jgi:hypothetical protein
MGNENSSQQQITYGKNGNATKGKNQLARGILANNVNGIPTDQQIAGALAIQQSQDTGPLKKTDLIAILIRLNPDKNNALLSQYKIEDLLKSIRYEVYVKPFGGVKQEQYKQRTAQSLQNIQVEDVDDIKYREYLQSSQNNQQQLTRQLLQLNRPPIQFKQQQLQYYEPLPNNNGNMKQLEYHR